MRMKFFAVFTLLAAVLGLTFGGRAWAAEADMQAFRGAYLQDVNESKGFHLELMFSGPTFQSNVISDGQMWQDGSAVADGKLSWSYTNLAAEQTQQYEMPFYAERSGNVVVFYGKRGNVWQKENILGGFSWLIDAVTSDDRDTKLKYAATVTDVQREDAGNGQLRMQLTFDGKALSEVRDKAVRDRIATMSEADQKDALATVHYLNAALAESNLKCAWTVDAKTGKTAVVTADLTDVMRNYAKAVLQDSYQGKISLSQEETDLLASIGYYYTLQVYLVKNDGSAKHAVIPAAVKNSAQEANIFADVNSEVVSAIKK